MIRRADREEPNPQTADSLRSSAFISQSSHGLGLLLTHSRDTNLLKQVYDLRASPMNRRHIHHTDLYCWGLSKQCSPQSMMPASWSLGSGCFSGTVEPLGSEVWLEEVDYYRQAFEQ